MVQLIFGGAGGDKQVQVVNHTVKVDGTTVTNSSGDLTTTSVSPAGGGLSGGTTSITPTSVTLSDTDNGIKIVADTSAVTRAAVTYTNSAGWLSAHSSATQLLASTSLDPAAVTKYISKITIPAGISLGYYSSATSYDDGVTISGAANSIGKLYAGFASSGYGELHIRDAGGTSYTKVADAGKLITTSRSASTGYVTLEAGNGSSSLTGTNVTLSDTNNGIELVATGSGTVSGTGYGKVSTGTGWVTSGTTSSNTSSKSSKSSNTATTKKIYYRNYSS